MTRSSVLDSNRSYTTTNYIKCVFKKIKQLKKQRKKSTPHGIRKSVVQFQNHKVSVHFDSLFITHRKNCLNLTSIDGEEDSNFELRKRHLFFIKSPFVEFPSDIVFHIENKLEKNSQIATVCFGPVHHPCSVDLEMAQMQPLRRNWWENRKTKALFSSKLYKLYPKHIPVDSKCCKTYLRTELDSRSPMCWLDIQAWYLKDEEEKMYSGYDKLKRSKSETSANEANYLSPSERKSHILQRMKKRFQYSANRHYLQCATAYQSETVHSSVEIFIKMREGSNRAIYKLRGDLLVDCVQFFFFPFDKPDINIHWVPSLIDIFAEKIENIANFSCVIELGGPACGLLRDRETAVLDTLGYIMGVKPWKIELYYNDD